MQAKVLHAFSGRPDHEALSRTINAGEIIDGDLAAVAVENKWAEEVQPAAPLAPVEKKLTAKQLVKAKAAAQGKLDAAKTAVDDAQKALDAASDETKAAAEKALQAAHEVAAKAEADLAAFN